MSNVNKFFFITCEVKAASSLLPRYLRKQISVFMHHTYSFIVVHKMNKSKFLKFHQRNQN